MNRLMLFFFVLAGCKASSATDAPGPKMDVTVMPATYAAHSDAPDAVVKTCKFDQAVAESIARNVPGATVSTGASSKLLSLEVVAMRGVDPDWEGESRVIVRGELADGGTKVGSFRIRRSALGGVMGGMRGICKALDTIAEDMGDAVARWLHEPGMDSELQE